MSARHFILRQKDRKNERFAYRVILILSIVSFVALNQSKRT